jgi:hypothetical protein
MIRVARWLFLSKGGVSKEGAKELARAECARRGIAWWEPVKVHRHYGTGPSEHLLITVAPTYE